MTVLDFDPDFDNFEDFALVSYDDRKLRIAQLSDEDDHMTLYPPHSLIRVLSPHILTDLFVDLVEVLPERFPVQLLA